MTQHYMPMHHQLWLGLMTLRHTHMPNDSNAYMVALQPVLAFYKWSSFDWCHTRHALCQFSTYRKLRHLSLWCCVTDVTVIGPYKKAPLIVLESTMQPLLKDTAHTLCISVISLILDLTSLRPMGLRQWRQLVWEPTRQNWTLFL
jgi:hypothetical protein